MQFALVFLKHYLPATILSTQDGKVGGWDMKQNPLAPRENFLKAVNKNAIKPWNRASPLEIFRNIIDPLPIILRKKSSRTHSLDFEPVSLYENRRTFLWNVNWTKWLDQRELNTFVKFGFRFFYLWFVSFFVLFSASNASQNISVTTE